MPRRGEVWRDILPDGRIFAALKSAGYKPKPIAPEEFIRVHLGVE